VTPAAAVRFSRRLPWATEENALALAQAERAAAGLPVLDLTVTNPTQVELPYPDLELAQAFADPALARYRPAPRGMSEACACVARDYLRRGVALPPDHIVLTASSSESYALLFKLLANPGQAILVPQPSYPLFDYLAALEGLVPRPYRLAYDGRWHIDFDSFDLSDVAAIVAVSPNNPTGSYLTTGDGERLCALAARHGLAIIADEVFADFPLTPAPDALPAMAGLSSPALTFSLGGLSKASGLPQMKLGWIAASGPPDSVAEALHHLDLVADSYLSVATPVQIALPKLLAIGAGIRASIRERLGHNLAELARLVSDSPCTLLTAEAGWSAIVRVPAVMSEEGWALRLLREHGVLVQPGYFFDLDLGATLVVSLLSPPPVLAEGTRRLLAAVKAACGHSD
jgi:aspartate/methionine/tyrosine aminotransferase